jgi:inward rectifier potassium channel
MQRGQDPRIRIKRVPREKEARVRIGSFELKKKGVSRFDLRDPYHLAIALTWPQFLAALLALYLAVNVVFATLFSLVPGSIANARSGSFADAFFFSIETLATVGYGEMYPATPYGRVVAATEVVCGLAFTAILTGLTFVRFSRPQAKMVFAANPVVAIHNDKPTLMVRIGNGRAAILTDAAAKLNVLLSETTAEGKPFRRAQELRLMRAHIPVFPLSWTLMHVLDEHSPFHGYDAARVIAADARVFVTLEAARPDVRDDGTSDPRLCARRHTLRHALCRRCDHGGGRHPGFGPDQDWSAGAGYRRRLYGIRLDGAGRRVGISDFRSGSWLCENADVRKTDGRIISPIANFVARILMRDRF